MTAKCSKTTNIFKSGKEYARGIINILCDYYGSRFETEDKWSSRATLRRECGSFLREYRMKGQHSEDGNGLPLQRE